MRQLTTSTAFLVLILTVGCTTFQPVPTIEPTSTQPPVPTSAPTSTTAPTVTTAPSVTAAPTNMAAVPEGCVETPGLTSYVSQGARLCFVYPEGYTPEELPGGTTLAIRGPMVTDPSGKQLQVGLVVLLVQMEPRMTAHSYVDDFVEKLSGENPPVIERGVGTLNGEIAETVTISSQDVSSREVVIAHRNVLYHLIFSPNPVDYPVVKADAEELYQVVTDSFRFIR